jgi:cell division protein FtsX
MYAGGSLFIVAIGAILYWAVSFHVNGVNLPMIGLILMVIGAIGVLFSLIGSATTRRRVV